MSQRRPSRERTSSHFAIPIGWLMCRVWWRWPPLSLVSGPFHRLRLMSLDFKPRDHEKIEWRGVIESARVLEGVVTRADTGKPVVNARVAAAVTQFYEYDLEFEDGDDTTDDAGR